jgi:hypothetical protein
VLSVYICIQVFFSGGMQQYHVLEYKNMFLKLGIIKVGLRMAFFQLRFTDLYFVKRLKKDCPSAGHTYVLAHLIIEK